MFGIGTPAGEGGEYRSSGQLNLYHFEKFVPRFLEGTPKKSFEESNNLNQLKVKMERDAIINVLQMTGGNKKRASEMLQLDRSVLYKKMSKYNIDVKGKAEPDKVMLNTTL